MSSLVWTEAPRLEEGEHMLTNLEALGITLLPPAGRARYEVDEIAGVVKRIGTLAAYPDGRITVLPCQDTTARETNVLLSLAVRVFRGELRTTGWLKTSRGGRPRRITGWWVQVRDDDPVARALAGQRLGQPIFWNEADRHAHYELKAETEKAAG